MIPGPLRSADQEYFSIGIIFDFPWLSPRRKVDRAVRNGELLQIN